MPSIWEFYGCLSLAFGLLMLLNIVPEINSRVRELGGKPSGTHTLLVFIVSTILMPVISLVVFSGPEQFIEAYSEAYVKED